MKLHHELAGRGVPLILLPGAAADGSAWRQAGFVDGLEDMFQCVMVDPPGMGLSGWPADNGAFAAGSIAHAVVDIADRLELERFVIWGASAGAAPAIVVAAEHPERVHALILSGAWPDDWRLWRDFHYDLAAQIRRQGGRAFLTTVYTGEGIVMPDWVRATDPDGEASARILKGAVDYDWSARGHAVDDPAADADDPRRARGSGLRGAACRGGDGRRRGGVPASPRACRRMARRPQRASHTSGASSAPGLTGLGPRRPTGSRAHGSAYAATAGRGSLSAILGGVVFAGPSLDIAGVEIERVRDEART